MEEKFVSIDLVWGEFKNKYEGLNKLIVEAKHGVELTGDTPNKAIFKAVDKMLLGKTVPLPEAVPEKDIKLP
ncbi:MAG: hypothetical protein PHX21_03440 [bacterium]|nr:hypothetical protein [bacterium]